MDNHTSIVQRDAPGGMHVPNLITQSELRALVSKGELLQDADPDNVEGIKYDFRLGPRFLKASFDRPVNYNELSETEKKDARVDPGEVVFVMSEEKVSLPLDMMIILSQKRKIAHEGIAIMGGLCVDPGYEGHLLVGLYNFSSDAFKIIPGKKLIAGLFYRLGVGETGNFRPPEAKIIDFPDELVRLIKSYQPVNVEALRKNLDVLRTEIIFLRDGLEKDQKWKDEFKSGLDGLLEALKDEKENREKQFTGLKSSLESTNEKFTNLDKEVTKGSVNRAWLERILVIILTLVIGTVFARVMGWITILP